MEYQYESTQNDLHSRLSSHPALQAIMKYRNHPSINIIRHFSQSYSSFYFSQVEKNTVVEKIRRMSSKKAVQETNIPVKILKENADFFAEHICRQFNEAICSSKFPATFKFANVTPAFKKGNRNQKDNYRPISILPVISKILEKLICRQLSNHFDNIFSKFQCGFRKGFSAQHCLFWKWKKWKKAVDNKNVFGAILTDLSKAFDCIYHDLLVAKLHAYGLSLSALKMIQDYLLHQKQRTKVGSSYSSWEILYLVFHRVLF